MLYVRAHLYMDGNYLVLMNQEEEKLPSPLARSRYRNQCLSGIIGMYWICLIEGKTVSNIEM